MGRVRRSRAGVILNILNEALKGVNKTRLMYRCNLNFARFNHYLQDLLDAGLIERIEDETSNPAVSLYKTTEKGKELLTVLRKADEFISI